MSVSHECDLALLKVEDETFWHGLPSLELGEVPELQDEVVIAGYPTYVSPEFCSPSMKFI